MKAEKPCIRCIIRPRGSHDRWCRPCRNAYARRHRPKHRDLSPEQRRRAVCRSYTNVLIARGKLTRGPCEVCGSKRVQAHHDDYSDPRNVRWLCKDHHVAHHRAA